MGRRPKGDRPLTTSERKQAQRLRDRRRLNEGVVHPEDAPLRILLQLVSEGHEVAWQEIGRRNSWMKSDSHDMGEGIVLEEDVFDRLHEEARYQKVSVHRLIEAILTDHLNSGKRVWA